MSLEQWVKEAASMAPNYDPPSADKYPDGTWERVTLTDYWCLSISRYISMLNPLYRSYTLNPKPYTLNPKPYTLNPKPSTFHPTP